MPTSSVRMLLKGSDIHEANTVGQAGRLSHQSTGNYSERH